MLPIAHISASLLSLSIYDKIRKAKDKIGLPSFCFIIIGFAGIFPDLLKPHLFAVGKTSISHSVFFPLIFLAIYLLLKLKKIEFNVFFLLFFIGTLIHLILDMISGVVFIFYPLSDYTFHKMVLFPAYLIEIKGVWYANLFQYVLWYIFDVVFFGFYIFVDKTNFLEKVIKKIIAKRSFDI